MYDAGCLVLSVWMQRMRFRKQFVMCRLRSKLVTFQERMKLSTVPV